MQRIVDVEVGAASTCPVFAGMVGENVGQKSLGKSPALCGRTLGSDPRLSSSGSS